MKRRIFMLLAALFASALILNFSGAKKMSAEEKTIVLPNDCDDYDDWDNWDDWDDDYDEDEANYYYIGDTGHFEIDYDDTWGEELVRVEYSSDNEGVVEVDEQGNYRVVGSGHAEVTVHGYTADDELAFASSYDFYVCADLASASLEKNSVKKYICDLSWAEKSYSFSVSLKNAPEMEYYTFNYASSNDKMSISCEFDADTKSIEINANSLGSTVLTFTINKKVFQLNLKITQVKMGKMSAILTPKKKLTLKVKGYSGKIKWGSTKKKVASVSSKGVVKAKKTGNTVIYATIEGERVGCAVSVVTPVMKKVIHEAKKIAKGTYSQERRMEKGYYDCSSLVWRSYKKAGKYFGDKNYAPVAANIAKWCFGKKKRIPGGLNTSNLEKMKLRPGDLFFEGGQDNGRYKGIYHVEMFVGYQCWGFYNNKPFLDALWAARGAGYYFSGMMARP